jgi:alkanesulfonate monooxygenase SsuD/methylene tetrahydromethanopterin reductase-like flavin-dependent oxidoreductase (luciferase family)
MISTLDIASGGRVILGVGAGWSQDEFEAYSTWGNTKYRVDKTIEGINLMVELWTKDVVNFNGKFYHAKDAVLDPKPVQKPYPRLLFGSQGDRMLRLTGRYGDICFIPPWSGNVTSIKEKVLDSAEKYGRTEKIEFIVGDMGSRGQFDEEVLRKKVTYAEEFGASIYLVSFPRENQIESMNRFAENIMPSFST